MPKTDTAAAVQASIDAFQSVIDAAATTDLQAQLDDVNAQIASLVAQRNDLNSQIAKATPDDVKKAQQAKQILEMLASPQGFAQLRRFGL